MKIEKLYDAIAETYNQKISAGVLSDANNTACSLIEKETIAPKSILALGIGDGVCLLPYKDAYPNAKLYGLDISENMLRKARERLFCETFHGDLAQASQLIDKKDFDLILAHFVVAYVPLLQTLGECKRLLSNKGLISVVTNTMSSFPNMQNILKKLEKSLNPLHRLVAHHVKQALKTVYVPKNAEALKAAFKLTGLKLQQLELKDIKVHLKTEQEVFEFFIAGGWFASGLIHPLIPQRVGQAIVKWLIRQHVSLPFEDHLEIAIAIGSKS
jgi:ubiquinone/menaquinone biosynthesis C-methylase UbiE